MIGAQAANLGRLIVAAVLLGIWAHAFGQGLRGPALPWFFASGVVGFGLGDLALFGALARIGPRLSILLTQCLAAPIAAATEYAWLGTAPRLPELICAGVILAGVALALAPDHGVIIERPVFWAGVVFGVCAALGQAFGAVATRKANAVALAAHMDIDGPTAAYQRIIGGLLTTVVCIAILRVAQRKKQTARPAGSLGAAWPMVLANAVAGPSVGVSCYQWALKTTPSAIVLPVVATSPLVTILLAFLIDKQRPSRRAVAGGFIAVAGAIVLSLLPHA